MKSLKHFAVLVILVLIIIGGVVAYKIVNPAYWNVDPSLVKMNDAQVDLGTGRITSLGYQAISNLPDGNGVSDYAPNLKLPENDERFSELLPGHTAPIKHPTENLYYIKQQTSLNIKDTNGHMMSKTLLFVFDANFSFVKKYTIADSSSVSWVGRGLYVENGVLSGTSDSSLFIDLDKPFGTDITNISETALPPGYYGSGSYEGDPYKKGVMVANICRKSIAAPGTPICVNDEVFYIDFLKEEYKRIINFDFLVGNGPINIGFDKSNIFISTLGDSEGFVFRLPLP